LPNPINPDIVQLPADLHEVLARQPPNVDRRTGAALVTNHFFPVSHRSLEAWGLPTRHVNGKAIVPTAALFAKAYAKLHAAPIVEGTRRATLIGLRKRDQVAA
jgi:hypothetical protein